MVNTYHHKSVKCLLIQEPSSEICLSWPVLNDKRGCWRQTRDLGPDIGDHITSTVEEKASSSDRAIWVVNLLPYVV